MLDELQRIPICVEVFDWNEQYTASAECSVHLLLNREKLFVQQVVRLSCRQLGHSVVSKILTYVSYGLRFGL